LKVIRLRAGRQKHHGSLPGSGKRFTSPPARPDGLSLLFNGHRRFFPQRQSGPEVNLTTHLHPVPRLRIIPLPHMHLWRAVGRYFLPSNYFTTKLDMFHS